MNDPNDDGVIPASKIKEAHAICMQDPRLARYFDDAPQGARQYIALMFYCTVFSGEVDDASRARYQQEVEEELTREDALYLATHETNPISKAHFRELYVALSKAESAGTEEGGALVPAPAVSTAAIERELGEVHAELQRLRRLTAELVTRESGAPGALTLGLLALVLFVLATATPLLATPIVLVFTFTAAACSFCAALHETRELKPCRVAGAIFAALAFFGGLALMALRFMIPAVV